MKWIEERPYGKPGPDVVRLEAGWPGSWWTWRLVSSPEVVDVWLLNAKCLTGACFCSRNMASCVYGRYDDVGFEGRICTYPFIEPLVAQVEDG